MINVRNDAEATRFWHNQKVIPENTYTYDTLYQLVSITGREMAHLQPQNFTLASPIIPLPAGPFPVEKQQTHKALCSH